MQMQKYIKQQLQQKINKNAIAKKPQLLYLHLFQKLLLVLVDSGFHFSRIFVLWKGSFWLILFYFILLSSFW